MTDNLTACRSQGKNNSLFSDTNRIVSEQSSPEQDSNLLIFNIMQNGIFLDCANVHDLTAILWTEKDYFTYYINI